MRWLPQQMYAQVFTAVVVLTTVLTAAAQPHAPDSGRCVHAQKGMVVSANAYASRMGRDVLRQGGNAVDAAVTTAFALAVTWPEAGNIGGGGFMMIRPADGRGPVCIDYRETAPGTATTTMFKNDARRHTRKMVGVPGTLRGLALAHREYGSLPWQRLVLPAALLAKEGFTVNLELARSINRVLEDLPEPPAPDFAELRRVYGKPGGGAWKPGDRIVLEDLSRTLRSIAIEGPDTFYTGTIADRIVDEMGDFNRQPGHTDRQGAIGTVPNRIAPRKRMLSSQTPVIVTRQGQVVLVTGSPGGRTIINTVLNVLLNVLEFGMDLPESVASPRMHHQWFPDVIQFEGLEEGRYRMAVEQLRAMGHSLRLPGGSHKQGEAHSILVDSETGALCGVADPRRGGEAAGH